MSMGNFVNKSLSLSLSLHIYMYIYIFLCVRVCVYVKTYMCMNMIVSLCSRVHILHLYVRFDYVKRCEDTVSVELCYIN